MTQSCRSERIMIQQSCDVYPSDTKNSDAHPLDTFVMMFQETRLLISRLLISLDTYTTQNLKNLNNFVYFVQYLFATFCFRSCLVFWPKIIQSVVLAESMLYQQQRKMLQRSHEHLASVHKNNKPTNWLLGKVVLIFCVLWQKIQKYGQVLPPSPLLNIP